MTTVTDWNMLVLFIFFCITGIVKGQISSQEHLDDIAKYLNIKVDVVDNLQFDGGKHLFQVTLNNKGSHALSGTNWKIYFFSFFVIEANHLLSADGNYIFPQGHVLEDSKLRINHANGCLYSLTPVSDFPAISPNTTRVVTFFGENWAVSRTDVPPNWYIVANGFSARVFQSTSGDFIGDFTEPNQWKRTVSDVYNPYSPLTRFNRYKKTEQNPKIKMCIPTPKEILEHDATVFLDMSGKVNIVHNGNLAEAEYLANKTNFKVVNASVDREINIYLVINHTIPAEEGYSLWTDTSSKVVQIQGKSNSGIFYGIQTLLAILADGNKIPKVLINDEPRYQFRGMHIDIARNFHQKPTLMKLMDAMAMYKLNKLHLHATDDEGWRLEIKDLPELTTFGSKRCHSSSENECMIPQLGSGPDTSTSGSGYLSIDDYKDILRYAKVRHIEVIPEVDMPGHARAAIVSMEARFKKLMQNNKTTEANEYRLFDPKDASKYLSVQYFNDNALSPCLESTFNFVDRVVKEIKAMHDSAGHPLKVFHFGGDEVARSAWGNSTTCQQLGFVGSYPEIRAKVKKHFAERVANITSKYGLNLLGWEDGFVETDGIPFDRKLFPNADVISNAWDNVWEWGEARRAYNFANAGYKVVMSHATHLYFDHPYEPDPEERGLYWAPRFTDTMKTFGFMPDDLYKNIDVTRMGSPLDRHTICGNKDVNCPPLLKPANIIGMQGHLWSETSLKEEHVYYMIFPRILALAERAWHKASWENGTSNLSKMDWDDFAHTVGKRELKRLDDIGINYRIAPPGASVEGNTATIESEFKKLSVEKSEDNGNSWHPVPTTSTLNHKFQMLLRTKSADGKRTSRSIKFNPVNQEMIDYMADALDIRYDVLDNLANEGASFLQRITITNQGSVAVLPGDWSIFFYHIRSINNLKPLPLPDCRMTIEHVSGSLYKLTPDRQFTSLLPRSGNTVKCDFFARYWSVATTDTMPNWYVWSEGTQPNVLACTSGDNLAFVGPFDKINKWKRYPTDQYDPFLPRTRYVINSNVDDFGSVDQGTYVIPTPVKMTMNKDKAVTISHAEGWVVLKNDNLMKEVKTLSEMYNISISSKNETSKVIRLSKGDVSVLQNGSKSEAYRLDVSASTEVISIVANERPGFFYAFQTLKRLNINIAEKKFKIYETHIEDEPRFNYRGLFLDVGRNFHTKDEIKAIFDVMATYKLNRFLFHLSEDEGWRLQIPGIEELTKIGSKRCHDLKERTCISSQLGSGPTANSSGSGYYTVEDYKELLAYANDNNIQVIPEFDMPGHARAAIVSMKERHRMYEMRKNSSVSEMYVLNDPDDKSEYMSVQWFVDNAMNPCVESTYTFIDHLVAEVKSMHAGIQDLKILSFGGDEVAKGAWEKSPKCLQFIKNNVGIDSVSDLKEYFARRVGNILGNHGLDIAAWEDGLMHGKEPFDLKNLVKDGRNAYTSTWDNVWEWGGGDRSYRMANAGYKVILAFATHLYFDHPYEPDPAERGYYWATRFTDTRKSFGFIPGNIYANADVKGNGSPLTHEEICGGDICYELNKPENIIGMMGLVWTETIRTKDQLQEMFFPRLLAVAERAWHKASWEDLADKILRNVEINRDWKMFANRLGYRELKYLDEMGIKYRIPVPGAKIDGDIVKTNIAFPGLKVEYRKDSDQNWKSGTITTTGSKVYLRTRSADGLRTSRVVSLSLITSSSNLNTYSKSAMTVGLLLAFVYYILYQ